MKIPAKKLWPACAALLLAAALAFLSPHPAHKTAAPSPDLPVRRILFIGNSYTYVNDLPSMIPLIAASIPGQKFRYVTEMVAEGGAHMNAYASRREIVEKIAQGHYDYVVLQEQSTTALYANEVPGSVTAIRYLANVAKIAHAKPVLYGTWPRKAGDVIYTGAGDGNFQPPANPQDMERRLEAHDSAALQDKDMLYAPAGAYWLRSLREHPGIALYGPDGSHPDTAGTYLTALLLYDCISQTRPDGVTWKPENLSEDDARALRAVAGN